MHVLRVAAVMAGLLVSISVAAPAGADGNLVDNGNLERGSGVSAAGFVMHGGAAYGALGDSRRDITSRGFTLRSDQPAGEVQTAVTGLKGTGGRWYRFTVRGLPQANFAVDEDDLYLKIYFFGDGGKTEYDAKARKIYDQVESARAALAVNGVRHQHGAEVWRSYQVDFSLPFPQVDTVKLAVGFAHGAAKGAKETGFLVDDFSLMAIADPPGLPAPATQPVAIVPSGKLLPIGGRWSYAAGPGESAPPKTFDVKNVDRLIYHDNIYSAPFAGNTSAWLRAGNMDAAGNTLTQDRLVDDNVTISFDTTAAGGGSTGGGSMIIRSKGIPNHPTGRFPEMGFGNPNSIQEQSSTFYFPLEPKENPQHKVTDTGNQNGALHMGPIGLAVNGVVFFNPFDMGNTDATNMMDRCCGHPNQDGQYHYHKYPICVNSPWADEGHAHSPLLGWAFDGVPLYGPWESDGVMAKDATGEHAINAFNLHYDAERGWHYHVTPGKFPYLIGGFWATEDSRDHRRGPPGGMGGRNGGPGGG
ncbi:MAG: hypothetical protein JWM57_1857, partial [Phycisphaerales bacterium]|nr:hypothetical protein [Phycisphaerales bacterium]